MASSRTKKTLVGKLPASSPELVIITGLSGSGKGTVLKAFEDLGFHAVDNMPIALVPKFADLAHDSKSARRSALVIDIRERQFLADFPGELEKLKRRGLSPFVVFFEASDEVLQRRFSETRRPHPADKGKGLLTAIQSERKALKHIRKLADLIIDTSDYTVHTLRQQIVQKFSGFDEGVPMKVEVVSFGHKYGTPRGLDLLFDVRHLPNPYFQKELKHLHGENDEIIQFLNKQPEVGETIDRFNDLLEFLLPKYQREGKSYLTIGIGCTGGRHRSVMVANSVRNALAEQGFDTSVTHRDLQK